MTTTVKIERKSNIRERRNRPRKVKMNYSKINDTIKTNKTSNTVVNVIKDTSENIIDKKKQIYLEHLKLISLQKINSNQMTKLLFNYLIITIQL